jgi:RNA polymerase sigma factor for flagellar operon FliA
MQRAYARYRPPDGERELIERHAPLLARIARRLAARTGHAVAAEDLWSAGALGLLEAVRRYDPARDVRFETFAEHRIRGAMLDEMRRMDHLPRRLRGHLDRVERARSRLAQRLGHEAGAEEIAEELGAGIEEVSELLQLLQPRVPMLEDVAASDAEPADESLGRCRAGRALAAAIERLPERLRILLALSYDEGLTYREIAGVLKVSEPRVCQLHADAVRRLREELTP